MSRHKRCTTDLTTRKIIHLASVVVSINNVNVMSLTNHAFTFLLYSWRVLRACDSGQEFVEHANMNPVLYLRVKSHRFAICSSTVRVDVGQTWTDHFGSDNHQIETPFESGRPPTENTGWFWFWRSLWIFTSPHGPSLALCWQGCGGFTFLHQPK